LVILSRASYALLGLAGIATIILALRLSDAQHWVQHTIDVRSQTRQLMLEMQDAIIRERGYILTENAAYLGDYSTVGPAIAGRLEKLRGLVADNSQQGHTLAQISEATAKLQAMLRETIDLVRNGKRDDAVELVRSNRVLDTMRSLKADVARFLDTEAELLRDRQREAGNLQNVLIVLIGLGLALAAALSVLLEISTRRFVHDLQARAVELEGEIKRRRETEATLQQSQKMEAIGQLTGGIAHDFNNLLTVILGNLDSMKRQLGRATSEQTIAALSAVFDRQIQMAMQAARNAAKLTHRLLAFARRQPLEPARIDCNRLISDMSELLRRTLGETVHLETVLAGGLWPTFADHSQLESALLNLAVNAQHAMPDGGRLTIETANTYLDGAYASRFGDISEGQYVQVSVCDTGTGIPADILDRVFEPFFTTKAPEAGSGLGLAMVHGFVKQSGGHVRIYSEVGHGTTVKIYLPRMREADAKARSPNEATPAQPPIERAHSGETILLVEDNASVRDYAQQALVELGYLVLTAGDAEEAMSVVDRADRIDLMFTDVVLPGGVSGRALSERVLAKRPDLPVLYTTGYTRNAIVHHGRLDPDVQLLNKPYNQQDLARKIGELLAKARARRSA
jgi:signal transduction histidine kinase/ActR/RegA family two-component response regulator